jgi:hypothetical protein
MGNAHVPPPLTAGGATPMFPVLTEELGYPPSPVGSDGGGASRSGGTGVGSYGTTVAKALQNVLGWKIKDNDPKGFVGALTQSFQLAVVEGAVVSTWTPRSYAVQSDLSGGVTGAQASVYTMAKTLVDQMLPLVDGLTPLNPAADDADIDAVKTLVKSQLQDLAAEIGNLGGPRVTRVNQYFQMLTGAALKLLNPPPHSKAPPSLEIKAGPMPNTSPMGRLHLDQRPAARPSEWADPDWVLGSLGELRDLLGLFQAPKLTSINTLADEKTVTNFRIIVDYAMSLLQVWANNIPYFIGTKTPFLGTQLVLISRLLGVVSEVVDEVRFVLDSVLVGPSQREAMLLDFSVVAGSLGSNVVGPSNPPPHLAPIYLEDLLTWIQTFVTVEAPPVIQDAGRIGVGTDFVQVIEGLANQAYGLYLLAYNGDTAMSTGRVLQSLLKLGRRLCDLYNLAEPVSATYLPLSPQP